MPLTMDMLHFEKCAELHVTDLEVSKSETELSDITNNASARKSFDNVPYFDETSLIFSEQYCRSLGDTRQGVGARQQYTRNNEIFENIFYYVYHEDPEEPNEEYVKLKANNLESITSFECCPCNLVGVKSDSKGFCVECRIYLCIECLKTHGRVNAKYSKCTKPIPKPRKTIQNLLEERPIGPCEADVQFHKLESVCNYETINDCEPCELPCNNQSDIKTEEISTSEQSSTTSSESGYACSSGFAPVTLIPRGKCNSIQKKELVKKNSRKTCKVKYKVDVISFLPKDKVITGMTMLYEGSVILTDNKNKTLIRISPKRNVKNNVTVSSSPYDVTAIGFNEVAFTLPSESRVQFAIVDIDSIKLGKKINIRDKCYGITAWKEMIAVSCKKSRKVKLFNRCGECFAEVKSSAEYPFCPDKIIIDQADGHLYVTDTVENRIQIFTISKQKIEHVKTSIKYFQYGNPSSLAISSLGHLYACYSYRRCVCRFPRNMTSVEELTEIEETPDMISVGGINSDLLSVFSKEGYLTVYETDPN